MDVQLESKSLAVKSPSWPLDAEFISYPIDFRGKDFYVSLAPYRSFDMKKILPVLLFRSEQKNKGLEIKDPDPMDHETKEFFWKYFRGFFGLYRDDVEIAPDAIKTLMEKKAMGIEFAIVRGCLGGARIPPEVSDDAFFEVDDSVLVSIRHAIYDPELRATISISMEHRLTSPTQKQFREYSLATGKSQLDRKSSEWTRTSNYDVIEQTYNSMVSSVSGVTLNGKSIDSANKAVWVDLIPFMHKELVLTEVFKTVEAKNAV